jgi:hypothetical protein
LKGSHPDLIRSYEGILLDADRWEDDYKARFVDYDLATSQDEDRHLKAHVQVCVTLSQYASIGSHSFILEDGPDVAPFENAQTSRAYTGIERR